MFSWKPVSRVGLLYVINRYLHRLDSKPFLSSCSKSLIHYQQNRCRSVLNPNKVSLSKYSIKDLEKITGIKAHTLRVWEKRYGLVNPKRGPNNVRCYCDKDLEKLVRIGQLNKAGYKISRLASLSFEDLDILYHNKRNFKCECRGLIDGLTLAVEGFEENRLFTVLNERLQQLGMFLFIRDVVKPLQERLGLLIVSGHYEKLHLDFAEDVIESIIIAENSRLSLNSSHSVASVLIVHLGSLKSRMASLLLKHMLLRCNVEVSMLGLKANEMKEVEKMIERKKFHEIYFSCNSPVNARQFDFETIDLSLLDDIPRTICGPGQEYVINASPSDGYRFKELIQVYEHIEDKYALETEISDFRHVNN